MEERVIKCSNCETMVTPLWRRGINGSYLCNACGLYYKIHHSNRPIEMKSDSFRQRQRGKKTGAIVAYKNSNTNKIEKSNNEQKEDVKTSSEYDDKYDDAIINYIQSKKTTTKIKFLNHDKISKKIKAFNKIEKSLRNERVYINSDSNNNNKANYDENKIELTNEEKNLSIEELEKIAVEVLVSLSKLKY